MVDILFVVPDLHRGGVGRCVYFMLEELPRHGLTTSLFCMREIEHEFAPTKARVTRGIARKMGNRAMQLAAPWGLIRLLATIRREKPAVVCSHGLFCNILVAGARLLSPGSFRSVAFEHNSPSAHYRATSLGGLKRLMLRLCYGAHDDVVGVSRGVVRDLVAMVPALRDKCRHIYNGIPLDDVRTQASAATPIVARPGKIHVVSVGRLVPNKGFKTLIEAAHLLNDPDIVFTIIGEGPQRQELEAMIAQRQPASTVRLAGHVDNPFPLLADADIFVSVSERESFGIVLVEALCLGVPVVATDCPSGPAEILEDGKFGELVPVGDAAAVAEAIRSLVRDAARREHLSDLGPQRAEDFSLERHCRNVADLFQPLLRKHALDRVGART
ncbi:glycosyltransferase [Bordetella genomosp. 9]|uniref:Glycosyl transferase n=1 Tax=Bordetella genomosp. 9 TaxID=1416803 RepID=A0A1W6Z231_9BORD|nr:glycosyltransferase [Bordetella genomosp. 9]ARP87427.1 glycosyl transferase [Bordetella genomosp. 9]ARP91408.1 glycosyl transferase [Bordetella genomosp. 9]